MPKRIMRRRAGDNEYLHPDFHCALNRGLLYLEKHFGPRAVTDYLRRFAREYYAPLTRALAEQGLAPLRAYIERIYAVEKAEVHIEQSEDEMTVRVPWCPAVKRIRERGEAISPLFAETTRAVNNAICEGTPFRAELREYDPETGAAVQRFVRRTLP
jgi:hypothetical protein